MVHEFQIGLDPLGHGCMVVGLYPGTEEVGEIFVRMDVHAPDPAKDTSDDLAVLKRQVSGLKQQASDLMWFLKGILDQLAIAVSIGLQRGIPLSVYVRKFEHTKFPPDGRTQNKDIPSCSSIVDYLFRWLDKKFGDSK
jgi:hypothetical protein